MNIHWMKFTLRAAAVYNLIWGAWVVFFPQQFFEWTSMGPINHELVWQGMGMVIGVYGFGYWWAAQDPIVHWPIVAVGMLGKLFGPLGFVINYSLGKVPFEFIYTLFTNDFIWWIPFMMILRSARKAGNLRWI